MLAMPEDPHPISSGSEGTIAYMSRVMMGRESYDQVEVDWDNGRSISLVIPPDVVEVIPHG